MKKLYLLFTLATLITNTHIVTMNQNNRQNNKEIKKYVEDECINLQIGKDTNGLKTVFINNLMDKKVFELNEGNSFILSPTTKKLVRQHDDLIEIIDLENETKKTYTGLSIAFSTDDKKIIIGKSDGTAAIYLLSHNLSSTKENDTIKEKKKSLFNFNLSFVKQKKSKKEQPVIIIKANKNKNALVAVAFSNNDDKVITIDSENNIYLWGASITDLNSTTTTTTPLLTLKAPHNNASFGLINRIAFSSQDDMFASSTMKGIYIWDVQSGKFIKRIPGNEGCSLSFIDYDTKIYAGKIFDIKSTNADPAFNNHKDYRIFGALSPNQNILITASIKENLNNIRECGVTVWDTMTKKSIINVQIDPLYLIVSLGLSSDGKILTTVSANGQVRKWNLTAFLKEFLEKKHLKQSFSKHNHVEGDTLFLYR